MDLPNLIETQTNSYAEFLQADVAPDSRKKQGLEEVFQSLFPITSVSGNAALEYVSYELGKNTYDVQECLIQGLSYSAPLRIKVKLVLFDRDSNFKEVKDIREIENLGIYEELKNNITLIEWPEIISKNLKDFITPI